MFGDASAATIGATSFVLPSEPLKLSPKQNMPPSLATRQYPSSRRRSGLPTATGLVVDVVVGATVDVVPRPQPYPYVASYVYPYPYPDWTPYPDGSHETAALLMWPFTAMIPLTRSPTARSEPMAAWRGFRRTMVI